MAELKKLFGFRHLRTESASFVMRYRSGKLVTKGRGLSFWFWPLSTAVSLVPMDDRELTFLFHGRSSDFQDVSVQGVITYRVIDPVTVSQRIDFGINLNSGRYNADPLEKVSLPLTQLAEQLTWDYVAKHELVEVLQQGVEATRHRIGEGLRKDTSITGLGLEVVSVRVSAVQPSAELERALQTPALEAMQEQADEATFKRRAMAVEKERAIEENELQTKLELARREEQLIEQRGLNGRKQAHESVEARRIQTEGGAEARKIEARGDAEAIRLVEAAQVAAERERMEIYEAMPSRVMFGLAARELASKLERIDHLNISPELLGPLFTELVEAGTKYLKDEP